VNQLGVTTEAGVVQWGGVPLVPNVHVHIFVEDQHPITSKQLSVVIVPRSFASMLSPHCIDIALSASQEECPYQL